MRPLRCKLQEQLIEQSRAGGRRRRGFAGRERSRPTLRELQEQASPQGALLPLQAGGEALQAGEQRDLVKSIGRRAVQGVGQGGHAAEKRRAFQGEQQRRFAQALFERGHFVPLHRPADVSRRGRQTGVQHQLRQRGTVEQRQPRRRRAEIETVVSFQTPRGQQLARQPLGDARRFPQPEQQRAAR
ncbi:MAG: hypothetical protein WBD29_12730 [Candidatus Competibacter sp.]